MIDPNDIKMTGKIELISPQAATELLASMPRQRGVKRGRVQAYCDDRINGRWVVTHQGIGINTRGQMIDGQHRMMMVVQTGLSTWFWVVRGIPENKESMLHVDDQATRSLSDACKIAGDDVLRNALVVAKSFYTYPGRQKHDGATTFQSRGTVLETLNHRRDGIQFSCQNVPKRAGLSRSVRVLVARAYYHVDHDRLAEFCQILVDGMPISKDAREDSAAICYRNVLLRSAVSGELFEVDRYRKGQACLRSFLAREPLTKAYACETDLYPAGQS